MISLSQERTATGEKLFVWTYQPCHLWMRWTLVPPRIHKVPVTLRGLTTMSDFYYCFDVYHDNEQEEEGDTFLHTFIKEPWPYCEKRYFYFHGQINGVNSPSTSPIFEKHPKEPKVIPACYSYDFYRADDTFYASDHENAQPFQPCRTYKADQLTIGLAKHPDWPSGDFARFAIYIADGAGKPLGDPIRSGTVPIAPPLPPNYEKYTIHFAPITLESTTPYAFSVTHEPNYDGPPRHIVWIAGDDHHTCPLGGTYYSRYLRDTIWDPWFRTIESKVRLYEIPEVL